MSDFSGGPAAGQPQTQIQEAKQVKERNASLWADAWRELIRNPVFVISTLVILVVLSMAFVPQLWTSVDPNAPGACDTKRGFKIPPPWWPSALGTQNAGKGTWEHPFGLNDLGCDYYAQAIYGASPSLRIAFFAVVGTVLIGGLLGMIAGFYGGWIDAIISRFTDVFLALPFLLGALVVLSVFKGQTVNQQIAAISGALIVLGWTTYTRILRGSVIEAKNQDYVHAAKALGAKNSRMMFKHILPNAIAPTLVIATISFGGFIGAEATLTFLGVGLRPPAVSWGVMISGQLPWFFDEPWLLVIPSGLLIATVLSFILIGDALRDALDPKLR